MNYKYPLYIVALIILVFAACKKTEPTPTPVSQNTTTTPPAAPVTPATPAPPVNPQPNTVNVYAVGFNLGGSLIPEAVYWKNDTLATLPGSGYGSQAYTVAVQGKDVYIGGTVQPVPNIATAAYWKNNVITVLTSSLTYSCAYALAVDGTDIYIAGCTTDSLLCSPYTLYKSNKAIYWKNGVAVTLPDSSYGSGAFGIAVSGSDVYVAGFTVTKNNTYIATYWKNGIPVLLNGVEELPAAVSLSHHYNFVAYSFQPGGAL